MLSFLSLAMKLYDLEVRLIHFANDCLTVAEDLPKTNAGKYFSDQLVRSGTSPALNYAEAQAAESRVDFIHKMKLCLKELRETFVCIKLITLRKWHNETALLKLSQENNQLIAIFTSSINTALKNKASTEGRRK